MKLDRMSFDGMLSDKISLKDKSSDESSFNKMPFNGTLFDEMSFDEASIGETSFIETSFDDLMKWQIMHIVNDKKGLNELHQVDYIKQEKWFQAFQVPSIDSYGVIW